MNTLKISLIFVVDLLSSISCRYGKVLLLILAFNSTESNVKTLLRSKIEKTKKFYQFKY